MRIATMQVFQRGLDSMLDQQTQLYKTQLQLSSGQRFTSPADDPTAAAQVLGLSESIAITTQYQTNAKTAEKTLTLEEVTLDGVVDALQRARELAVGTINDTRSDVERNAAAQEIRQLMDHILSLANTRDENGEYIFAGFQSRAQPFAHDGLGTFSFNGDQGQRQIQIGPSRTVAVGDSGFDVFMKIENADGSGYQDVFTTLHTLATGLEANNPDPSSITAIDKAMDNVLSARTNIGARLNALEREDQVNIAYSLQLETTRSQVQDLDMAQASVDLNRQMLVLQAAQQAFVKVQGLSLFNYL